MVFSARRSSGADDPNAVLAPLNLCNEQESLLRRQTNRDEPAFVDRMIWIVERKRERIEEHSDCLVERDSVLSEVSGRLVRIPFIDHNVILLPGVNFVVPFK